MEFFTSFIPTATFTWEAHSMLVQTGQKVFVIVDAWGNYKCLFDSCGFSDTLPLCAGHCSPTLLSGIQRRFLLRVYTPASEGVCFSTARLSSLFLLQSRLLIGTSDCLSNCVIVSQRRKEFLSFSWGGGIVGKNKGDSDKNTPP